MGIDLNAPLDDNFLTDFTDVMRETIGDDLARERTYVVGKVYEDGSTETTVVEGEYGAVWIRDPGDDSGDAVQAINLALQAHEITFNRPVSVKTIGKKLYIRGRAPESADYDADYPVRPQRASNRSQLDFALVRPTKPGSMAVYLSESLYEIDHAQYRVIGQTSLAFDGTLPANQKAITIEVTPANGSLTYNHSGEFSGQTIRSAFTNNNITYKTPAEGRYIVGHVLLYAGQTEIVQDDVLPGDWYSTKLEHLNGLYDVSLSSPEENDHLVYDGTLWTNKASLPLIAGFERGEEGVSPTDSQISYDPGTRTVSVAPTGGGEFNYWLAGEKYTVDGTLQATHPDTTGGYFFYYDATNTLQFNTTPWSLIDDVPIAYVFYSATLTDGFYFEERHGVKRSLPWHYSDHWKRGTYWNSGGGLGISGYTLSPASPADSDNQWAIASGNIHDEDINFAVSGRTAGSYEVFYRSGASGEWLWTTNNVPLLSGGSYLYYNEWTGATWQQAALTNNKYVNYYIMTTSSLDSDFDIFVIMGQTEYSTLTGATNENISDLSFGELPFQEVLSIYQVTFRTNAAYSSEGKCRIESVEDTRESVAVQIISASPAESHSALSNLNWVISGHDGTLNSIAGFGSSGEATIYDQVPASLLDAAVIIDPGLDTRNVINPSTNIIPLTIQANTSPGKDQLQIKASSGSFQIIVNNRGRLQLRDQGSTPPLAINERTAAPSNQANHDLYIDDGSNTATGQPNWMHYQGSWGDLGATELNHLSDVSISSPAADEVLGYDGTLWVNQAAGAGSLNFIEEKSLSAATNTTFTGLSGVKRYYLRYELDNATASITNIEILANADASNADYADQTLNGNGATVNASRTTNSARLVTISASNHVMGISNVGLAPDGGGTYKFMSMSSAARYNAADTPAYLNYTTIKNTSVASLTQIEIVASVASSMNGKIALYEVAT
jgi:hypothetical protein